MCIFCAIAVFPYVCAFFHCFFEIFVLFFSTFFRRSTKGKNAICTKKTRNLHLDFYPGNCGFPVRSCFTRGWKNRQSAKNGKSSNVRENVNCAQFCRVCKNRVNLGVPECACAHILHEIFVEKWVLPAGVISVLKQSKNDPKNDVFPIGGCFLTHPVFYRFFITFYPANSAGQREITKKMLKKCLFFDFLKNRPIAFLPFSAR